MIRRPTAGRARWIGAAALALIVVVSTAIRFTASAWSVDADQPMRRIVETDESTFFRHFKGYPDFKPTYVDQTTMQALVLFWAIRPVARALGVPDKVIASDLFGYRVGRLSSVLAGIAFLLLIYLGGPHLGLRDRWQRVAAVGILAFSPLISVYSHLFVADAPNLLWMWIGFYAFVRFVRLPDFRYAVLFAVAAGFASATKLSMTYFVIPGLALLLCAPRPVTTALMMLFIVFGAFWLGNGFNYSIDQMDKAVDMLKYVQKGGHTPVEFSALTNLRNMSVFFVAGLGIPVTLAALGSLGAAAVATLRRLRIPRPDLSRALSWGRDFVSDHPLAVLALGLLLQLAISANMAVGGLFARHVIPFLPLVVLLTVRFLGDHLPARPVLRVGALTLVLGYQLLFCLDGERGFYNDPRARARAWLKSHRTKDTPMWSGYYSYDVVVGLPNVYSIRHIGPSPVPTLRGKQLFVVHQATYSRYLLADACKKIQHCLGGDKAREFFVKLIAGRAEGYKLVFEADPGYVMPEHRLLRRVVPTHPFGEVGVVRIYRGG